MNVVICELMIDDAHHLGGLIPDNRAPGDGVSGREQQFRDGIAALVGGR
jgi:hypothetical protein